MYIPVCDISAQSNAASWSAMDAVEYADMNDAVDVEGAGDGGQFRDSAIATQAGQPRQSTRSQKIDLPAPLSSFVVAVRLSIVQLPCFPRPRG